MNYFLDTEFDGFGGELLSMALIREDYAPGTEGRDAYYVTRRAQKRATDQWVAENVVPILWDCPFIGPRIHWDQVPMAMDIAMFLHGDDNPCIVCDWPDDIAHLCKVLVTGPGIMPSEPKRLAFRMVRVDSYPTAVKGAVRHNAWWDAMALRAALTGKGL